MSRGGEGLSPLDFPLDLTELHKQFVKHRSQSVQLTAELGVFVVYLLHFALEIDKRSEFLHGNRYTPVRTGHGLQNAVNRNRAVVTVEKDLPFLIHLDTADSVMSPGTLEVAAL